MNSKNLKDEIQDLSYSLGFDLFGVAKPSIYLDDSQKIDKWLENNFDASMAWIKNRSDERKNIYKYFPEVKSIISLGHNYYSKTKTNSKYKISNYAWGEDYHLTIKEKLKKIIDFILKDNPSAKYRLCVDTSPLMEKAWAQRAGLGWIGKHTNLINKRIGSWFFISEILLDFELDYNNPFINDLCGTCVKCIDACPTDALDEYILDSNKCISYLTIEHRGEIEKKYKSLLSDWIYGCDICQDVCPWNIKYSKETFDEKFHIRDNIKNKSNNDWENLSVKDYQITFKNSAIKRAKYEGILRNIDNVKE